MAIESRSEKGPGGKARVSVKKDKVIVTFDENHQSYEILKEEALPWMITGEYFVSLNADMDRIVSARPPLGSYHVEFKEIWHEEGKEIVPRDVPFKSVTPKQGTPFTVKAHPEFTALFEVIRGEYNSFVLSMYLWYVFKEDRDNDTGECILVGTGRKKVEQFLTVMGFDLLNDSIPYSDNILPWLQEEIYKRNKSAMLVTGRTGWVRDILPGLED